MSTRVSPPTTNSIPLLPHERTQASVRVEYPSSSSTLRIGRHGAAPEARPFGPQRCAERPAERDVGLTVEDIEIARTAGYAVLG
jgi:hypothetical protein